MERQCRQCETSFTFAKHQIYCSGKCVEAARIRTCPCGKQFRARWPSQKRTLCDDCKQSRLDIVAQTVFRETRERQIAQAHVLVTCNYAQCPRPEELIPLIRSQAKKPSACRHPECRVAYRADCHGGNKLPAGNEAFCEGCGKSRGYRPLSYLRKYKYCPDCVRHQPDSSTTSPKEWVPCALHGCNSGRLIFLSEIKRFADRTFYCSREHFIVAEAIRRGAARIHCNSCGQERRLHRAHVPQTLDFETMTFVCRACRPVKTVRQTFICDRTGCSKIFARRVPLNHKIVPHFCSLTCRAEHYRSLQRLCAHCRQRIKRRGRHNMYCTWQCYQDYKKGRPNPHHQPSKAEQKVLDAMARGIHGVRTLERECGVARNTVRKVVRAQEATSEISETTVRKFIKVAKMS